jgi:hypothetical protein
LKDSALDWMKGKKLIRLDGGWKWIPIDEEHPHAGQIKRRPEETEEQAYEREFRRKESERISKEPPTCGNCRHNRFTGVMIVKQEFGQCDVYKQSGREVNRPTDEACPCWRRKSSVKIAHEKAEQSGWREKLANTNFATGRRKPQ